MIEIPIERPTQLVPRRLLISTGEVSGDLQGALLIEALRQQAALAGITLEISALGGEQMRRAGATLLADTSAIGSIGLFETLPYIWATHQIQRQVQQHLRQHPPDLVVMIDYFAPNLGLGRVMRQQFPQTPTVYYIAPQEWVWSLSPRNTRQILAITDRLLAIFPAEAAYYRQHGAQVNWVGHPLIDWVQNAPSQAQARDQLGIAPEALIIALIPASRQQEIRYVLPVILAAARQIQAEMPEAQFWLPVSLERYRQPIQQALGQAGLQATLVPTYAGGYGDEPISSQTVIAAADLVISKTGTVNLETALLNVPQVVMYRVNPLTAWIAEHLLRFSVPFASPPNLVMMERIVPEFLQQQAQPQAIAAAALNLLKQPASRKQMQERYWQMQQKLGEPGVCARAACAILQLLQEAPSSATARLNR
jgi:lipid-A-disaccharide synthase